MATLLIKGSIAQLTPTDYPSVTVRRHVSSPSSFLALYNLASCLHPEKSNVHTTRFRQTRSQLVAFPNWKCIARAPGISSTKKDNPSANSQKFTTTTTTHKSFLAGRALVHRAQRFPPSASRSMKIHIHLACRSVCEAKRRWIQKPTVSSMCDNGRPSNGTIEFKGCIL